MLFLRNSHFPTIEGKLEKRDQVITHELRRDIATNQGRKLLRATLTVLLGLNDRELVLPSLGLNGNHVLAAVAVDPNVNFIDFDLTDASDRGAQMFCSE